MTVQRNTHRRSLRLLLVPAAVAFLLGPGGDGEAGRPAIDPALGSVIAAQGNQALVEIRAEALRSFRRQAFPQLPPVDEAAPGP